MNNSEAKALLQNELLRYRQYSYDQLLGRVGTSEHLEKPVSVNSTYQIQIQVFFDDENKRTLRVLGSIDDGGWRAFSPLNADFIVGPDGVLIGE